MECEMCGKTIGTRRHLVDGTVMNLGACCARYGQPLDQPAPPGSKAGVQQGLERRAVRQAARDVYTEPVEDLVADFGMRVRQAREKRGWTHEQLGGKVSARVPELHKIESNHLRPSDDLARRLEKELGIQLFERVEAGPVSPKPKAGAGGLTLGDILRDQLDKKGEKP